jgi:hypothetical protein
MIKGQLNHVIFDVGLDIRIDWATRAANKLNILEQL